MLLVITVDASGQGAPKVSLDADVSDPVAVTFVANHPAAVATHFKQLAASFYSMHTAHDHARQRQKLIAVVLADLQANFPAQSFTLQVVSGTVAAALKGG